MSAAAKSVQAWLAGHWRAIVPGCILWSLVMAASAYFSPVLRGWGDPGRMTQMLVLFGLGGVAAFPLGLYLTQRLAAARPAESRFAAALLCFLLATLLATAFMYVFANENFFLEWDEPFFTPKWVLEVIWSSLASLYQFAMLGMRLYFPVGFCALFAVAVWFSRLPH